LQGNLVSYKSYKDSLQNWYHGLEGSFIKTSDGGFALAGSTNSLGLLFKFDHNLDTLWKREYILSTATLFYGCAETESGYAMIGAMDDGNGFTQMILVKTDLQGNYLWEKHYGGQYQDGGYKIIRTNDSGYLLGGITYSFNSTPELGDAGDWYLVKTDSLGNMQWQKHFGNPDIDDGRVIGMIQTYDSCYIITGAYATQINFADDPYRKPRILKLNQSGNIIWDRKYGDQSYYPCIGNIIENNDHTLLSLGKDIFNKDILVKFTSDGNIILIRHFLMLNSTDGDQVLEYLDHANDEGYILVGWGLISGYPQEAWIIKTDSLGCDGFQSCQDTALAMHVWPGQITVVEGSSFTIKTYIDNGKGPVTVSYSNGETHYPVYLSYPDYTDSLVYTPTQDTVIYVTASYGSGQGIMDSTVFHVIQGVDELNVNSFEIFPNPAENYIIIEYAFINKPEDIKIYSSQGACLKSIPVNSRLGSLKISLNFAPGVYYVKSGNSCNKLVVL